MIISVSRRSDIPAFYSEWFFNRLKAGFVHVPNPFNSHLVREIPLNHEAVDCFVFWSKNPAPLITRIDELRNYAFYFQFTLNPYGIDVEPGFPDKNKLIETFVALSDRIGPHRLIWRYDPILFTPEYTLAWHLQNFANYCHRLANKTRKVVISFYDSYRCSAADCRNLHLETINDELMKSIAKGFSEVASSFGLQIESCSEAVDLQQFKIEHGRCIDDRIVAEILERPFVAKPDPNQRSHCGCAISTDIGVYSTCPAACRYCYANKGRGRVAVNIRRHNPAAPILISR